MDYVIRKMQLSDLPSVMAIEKAVQDNPWDYSAFEKFLEIGQAVVLLVKGKIVGFIMISTVVDEAEILNIAVAKGHQGKGFGNLLIQHVISLAKKEKVKKIFLEVRKSNHRAIKLYKRNGFKLQNIRKDYYQSKSGREDALVFECLL